MMHLGIDTIPFPLIVPSASFFFFFFYDGAKTVIVPPTSFVFDDGAKAGPTGASRQPETNDKDTDLDS
ncbi:hypothetical protein ACH5RR_013034 [Cinchona calisaya]|uniref:Uncharacterized protein n=1 Tax=Cinchona calisaya TaxID=153742 RepID=A0ABD3A1J3_9GENT